MKFEWTDNEHTSFSIVAQDPGNNYFWKKAAFAVFELENSDYTYSNVRAYLNARYCQGLYTLWFLPGMSRETTGKTSC